MRETDKAPDAFRTISEVAEELDLPQHVLRFWESRFTQIKPVKRAGGRRFYRPDDVDLLRGIRQLLYSDGYTIKGVQRILKEQGIRHVQDLGVEQTAAVMRSDVRPPAPAAGREEGTTFGGLLGLLPRRKARPQDDDALPALPPTAELPLPFPDAEADHDLSAHRHPEDPVPLRAPQRAEPRLDTRHLDERYLDDRMEPHPTPRRQAEAPPERRAHRGRGGDETIPPGRAPQERIDPTFAPPPVQDDYFSEAETPGDGAIGDGYPPSYPQAEPPRHRPDAPPHPTPAMRAPGQQRIEPPLRPAEPPLDAWPHTSWDDGDEAMSPPESPSPPRQQPARPVPTIRAPTPRVGPAMRHGGPASAGEAWPAQDWGDDDDAMKAPAAPPQGRQLPARPAPGVPQPRPSRGPASRITAQPPAASEEDARQGEIWREETWQEDAWQKDAWQKDAWQENPRPEPEDLPPILPPRLPPAAQPHVAQPPLSPAPRPTRGPAAQPIHAAATPELEDPLLPFFDQDVPDSGTVSEPIEERIRRLKARVDGPPPEFIPARARPPQPSPPMPPAHSGPAADDGWPDEESLPPLRPLATRRPAPAAQPPGPPYPAAPPFGAPQGWPPAAPAPLHQAAPYSAAGSGPGADPHWSGWAGDAMPLPPHRPSAAAGPGGPPLPEPVRRPPDAASPRWTAAPWEAAPAAAPSPPFADPRAPISAEPIPGWLRAPVPRYGEGQQPPIVEGAGQPRHEGGAHDSRTPPPEPARQGPPIQGSPLQGPPEQYLPPHLRADPRAPGQPPVAAPVLSRDDVYRLQAALYELGECRRLMDDALGAEAGEDS